MSPISVHRVYWWSDWVTNVKCALRQLWTAAFGCQHSMQTIHFMHIPLAVLSDKEFGTWHVNRCSKCGMTTAWGTYSDYRDKWS
jgi:hypothetical protein